MKKIVSCCLLLSLYYCAPAQKGLYIVGGLGYAIPMAGQTVDGSGNPYSGSVNYFPANQVNNAFTVKKVSFSSGANARVGVGYMFSTHVGVELSGYATFAPQHYTVNEVNAPSPGTGAYLGTATISNYAQLPAFLMPALVYNTGGKNISGYARGGFVLPISSNIEKEETDTYNPPEENVDYLKQQTKTRFGMGVCGAMGVEYKLGGNASVWLEANFISISLYAKDETVTAHTFNGDPNAVPTPQPAVGSKITYGYNGTYVNQQPAYAIPFSNAGLSAGIKIHINIKKKQDS